MSWISDIARPDIVALNELANGGVAIGFGHEVG